MLAQLPRLLTDGHDSVVGQTLGAQQESDFDSEDAVKLQTVGLATAQCEIDIKEEEDEDWELFKEAFSFICCCNEFEANAAFKETLSATGGSTLPLYEVYSADKAGPNAEASCMSDAEGEEA